MVGIIAIDSTWEVTNLILNFCKYCIYFMLGRNDDTMCRFCARKNEQRIIKNRTFCSNTIMAHSLINLFVRDYTGNEYGKTFNQMVNQP